MTTETTALRQELHNFIDIMPERKLSALKPLISILMEEAYPIGMEDIPESEIVIETDLTDEERAIIARGVARYHKHPEEFVTLDSVIEKVKNHGKRI